MAQRISRAKQRIKASGVPFRMPTPAERARAARRRAARALPDLQRGLREQRRPRPAARRSVERGDPADPRGPRPAPGRRRGGGAAGADAAHRRPAHGADRPGRRADPARRSRIGACGTARPIAEGVALDHRRPCPGARSARTSCRRDRRRARRGGDGRGHRLAADPGAVRPARTHVRQPHGGAQPRRSPRPWCTARRPGSSCSGRSTPTGAWRGTIASTPSGRTCWRGPATGGRPIDALPRGGGPHDERSGAELPHHPSRPAHRPGPAGAGRTGATGPAGASGGGSTGPAAPSRAGPARVSRRTTTEEFRS